MPQGDLPAALLHGPMMLYLVFPPFMLGFLLTVFPRWMGQSDLGPRQFGPVAMLQAAGALAAHAGLWSGTDPLLLAGFGFLHGFSAVLASGGTSRSPPSTLMVP